MQKIDLVVGSKAGAGWELGGDADVPLAFLLLPCCTPGSNAGCTGAPKWLQGIVLVLQPGERGEARGGRAALQCHRVGCSHGASSHHRAANPPGVP